MKNSILLYGASGYMGQLFTRYALSAKLPIIPGGRTSVKTSGEQRIFSLNDVATITTHLADIKLLVNLAGPFVHTQKPIIEACLETGTHYIDISGEVPEFESAFRYDTAAKQAGIMLMPGAGFGVVPTDIAAKLAYQRLRDASKLVIAYKTRGGASRGTLKTVFKDIHNPGIEIKNGKAVSAMPGKYEYYFEADGKTHRLIYNPWRGDLFTALQSTGIPNIQTYANFPGIVEKMMKGKLLWLRNLILNRLINFLPAGPSEKELQKGNTFIYAQVENDRGQKATVTIQGPEAYVFTAQTLTNISQEIIQDNWKAGFQTPSIFNANVLYNNYNNVIID